MITFSFYLRYTSFYSIR